jgi:hypothetical protein
MGWKPPPFPRQSSFQEIIKRKEKSARRALRLNKIIIISSASASIFNMVSAIIQWRPFASSLSLMGSILSLMGSICFLVITLIYLKGRSNLVNELNNVMVENIMES